MFSPRHAARLAGRGAALGLTAAALASSHSDAPLTKQDPQINLTDVYAFLGVKYDDPQTQVLNVVVNVRPFSEPGDGVIYDRFADDARYSIHITDPTTGATQVRYDFQFSAVDSGYKNLDTVLQYGLGTQAGPIQHIGDARQNYTQTYTITRVAGSDSTLLGQGLLVAPPNVGKNVTPAYNDAMGFARSGAAAYGQLDVYTQEAISSLPGGQVAFAGPRDDSFFSDIPGIFDLLNLRILDNNGSLADGLGQDGNGTDGFKGFNVLTFAMQIPLSDLTPGSFTSPFFGQQTGVGVYATVSRQAIRFISAEGDRVSIGPWVQLNRLGNPLLNEGLVATRDKDRFNRMSPTDDLAHFAQYSSNPELATLINFVYGTSFQTSNRTDLAAIFAPDVLRVSTTTGPVRLAGQPGFSRLGFIGGDTTGGVSGGWPNGRRLGDDVVDIALTAIASGPAYQTITVVGDNVDHNDLPYHLVFPYAATPHSGTANRKDRISPDINQDGMVGLEDLSILLANWATLNP